MVLNAEQPVRNGKGQRHGAWLSGVGVASRVPGWPGPVAGTGVQVIGQLRGDGSPAVQKSVIS